ncbi:efflux transporter outer membrane subunit [Sandaracinobacter neustonicus]|uniref:Efflux transporter outer membrane subunit n=1 Tax=Sandaracinobacter neustonicus TaxID=1715348 RepID=A0A501XMQ4_9SPHN|nr:efflux transporter outer membrane subunit [Sandaracinobacter neustonicus]TPE61739.1 efflux transporter outer membrane subunit [Sandaracinobacter neustonicus]
MQANRLNMAALLLLGGCVTAPPPGERTVPVAPPQTFEAAAANTAAATDISRWWAAWQDPGLNALVEQALAASPGLREARARVEAARATVTTAESALYPTIAAGGAAWHAAMDGRLSSTAGDLLAPYERGRSGTGHIVGLGATWEPDIFGGARANISAASAMVQVQENAERGARLTLVADIVENYQQAQGIRRRQALLTRSIAEADHLTAYAAARMRAGQATAADISRAENAAAALKAEQGMLDALLDGRKRRLAVLAGATPETPVQLSDPSLPLVPAAPTGQLPSDVLARRPDVLASAAVADIRAAQLKRARADLLPRFSVNFVGQTGHIALGGLPGFNGQSALLGLSAWIPLFTANRLQAGVRAGDAELRAALAAQDAAVLQALGDVETAYAFRAGLESRLEGLRAANAISSRRADEQARLYRSGRVRLSDVIEARLQVLKDEDSAEQARIAQASATVQLYRALGGGW